MKRFLDRTLGDVMNASLARLFPGREPAKTVGNTLALSGKMAQEALLILNENTEGMDPATVAKVRDSIATIKRAAAEGMVATGVTKV